ncbi:hypothetical protein LguiB_033171 [Lonicera macranthoides]
MVETDCIQRAREREREYTGEVRWGKVFGGEFAGCGEEQRGRGLTVEIEKCDARKIGNYKPYINTPVDINFGRMKNVIRVPESQVLDRLQKDGRLSATQPDYNFVNLKQWVRTSSSTEGIFRMQQEQGVGCKLSFGSHARINLMTNVEGFGAFGLKIPKLSEGSNEGCLKPVHKVASQSPLPPTEIEAVGLFSVKESYKRQGIGEALLKASIEKCRSRNVHCVPLHKDEDPSRISDVNLYKKLGFQVNNLIEGYYSLDRNA